MSTALKWKTPAELYDAPDAPWRPVWWNAWVAYLAGISTDQDNPYRENEVWRWYEVLWLQDPQILEEIGTRAARGVAWHCEEAQARGYAGVTAWRLAVKEEVRLTEARRLEAEAQQRAEAQRRQEEWRLQRWEESKARFREEMIADAPEKRRLLPAHAAWCAWLFAGGSKVREIEALMGVRGGIGWLIGRYIEAYLPEEMLPPTPGSVDPFYVPDRRRLLKAHFAEVGTPSEALPPPQADQAVEGRNRWVWLERERGQGLAEIAADVGVVPERVRGIYAAQGRKEIERERRERLAASIARDSWRAARRNLGRPLDMGGPRDRWLVYEPWTPEGVA